VDEPKTTNRRRILFRPFNPDGELAINTQHHLPHWTQPGATYFLTYRLGDAVPQNQQRQWAYERDIWLKRNPRPWTKSLEAEFDQRFTQRYEAWLDAGMGACYLRRPEIRERAEASLTHFDDEQYDLDAYVLMPNHVHALLTPRAGHELFDLLKGIKGVSARRCNQLLRRTGETFWMEDTYNRIVRDGEELLAFRAYIQNNPAKAGLQDDEFTLVMNDVLYIEA
jgi:REP element-mobilizing transposase RayT